MKVPGSKSLALFIAGAAVLSMMAINLLYVLAHLTDGREALQKTIYILLGIDVLALFSIYCGLNAIYLAPRHEYIEYCNKLFSSILGSNNHEVDLNIMSDKIQSLVADQAGMRSRESLLIENAVDVICVMDFQGKFLTVNPSAEYSWGYRKEELLGQQLSKFVSEDSARQLDNILSSPFSIKKITFDNQMRHKDGHLIDFSWSAHWSVSDEGLFCVARDISDRKRAERLQREFTAMVNHDLSAPLTSVAGFITLISEGAFGELDPAGKERCRLAGNELARLMRLINDLLDVERMESGSLKIQSDLVSVQDIIEESAYSVQTFAELRQIKLQFAESDLPCWGDRKRIIQVLVNLLSNAIKFSPAGSTVSIAAEELSQRIRFSVKDQGHGIPPEKAASLFKRFQQIHKESDTAGEGFGLGLSICKLIIDAHGGEIGCISDSESAGTEFWFTLAASG